MRNDEPSDYGGAILAVILIAFGAFAIYDTTTYADPDSAVFPRIVAIGLVAMSALYLLMWIFGFAGPAIINTPGSWPRRIAFVIIMLLSVLAMPWVGFLLSALVSFAVLMAIAMYDRWTPKRAALYGGIGIAIVLSFYAIFAKLLLVPLPKGWLFQG